MIGLDTNVIARIVLLDDPVQSPAALEAVAQAKRNGEPLVATLGTLLELEWVMRSCARVSKAQALVVFNQLLESNDLVISEAPVLEAALFLWKNSSADFAECLFLAQYQRMGCRHMLTFDLKAARMSGVELVPASV